MLVLALGGTARADDAATERIKALSSHFSFTLSDRIRGEFVDWFRPPQGVTDPGANRYNFFANQLRFGIKSTWPHVTVYSELQDVRLAGLPDDASLAPPQGNLGPGALYYANTHGLDKDTSQGETILKQAYATLADPPGVDGLALTGGRFEYSDALEVMPQDPALQWLKKARLGERLIGPFGYTHYGRAFDGLRLVYDQPLFNITTIAFRPTHGGFEASGTREMGNVGIAGITGTLKKIEELAPIDVRAFYFYYQDRRFADHTDPKNKPPIKVDNRPLPDRVADTDSLNIHTFGGHAITVINAGPGRVDGLVWGTIQTGNWGRQNHHGWAYAVETGYQFPDQPWSPWLRAGYDYSSGDHDPTDHNHDTFFQMIPTARIYAQFPFYNLMNSQDTFTQLIVKPHSRLTMRFDYHWLRLNSDKDLWYAGGGAGNDDIFGFSGIPANSHHELAHLVDLGATLQIFKQVSAYAYYGHAFGEGVVKKTFSGNQGNYGYVELAYRY